MEDHPIIPKCPICGKNDRVNRVSELAEKENNLATRLAPPEKPTLNRPLIGLNEGIGCLGALFFGSALFLAVTYGSTVAAIIFAIFVLLFSVSILLTILRGWREHKNFEKNLFAWEQEMERWVQQYYCARDDLLFTPGNDPAGG